MTDRTVSVDHNNVIARIQNKDNPDQEINILYFKEKNAFVTSGIQSQLGVKEIMIPTYLVARDLQLIGAILSAILEKISQAYEKDTTFDYPATFEVLGKIYCLTDQAEYVELGEA